MNKQGSSGIAYVLLNPAGFILQVFSSFRANQGFLLSGAVAYYTLLSIVPMSALILMLLSQVMDPGRLLDTTSTYLEFIAPGHTSELTEQARNFVRDWKVIGVVGLVILLFFSSMAFTVLENAMSIIFHHRVVIHRRHFLVSAILPYCYMLLLTVGLFMVSTISTALHTAEAHVLNYFGYTWLLQGSSRTIVYLLGLSGEILLLTSLYLVMPVGRLVFRHALIGGLTAALLWELTRHFLVWYFSTLSLVNVIYGSLTSAIVILLTFEAAAIIVLLGAQVIAEYERIGSGDERRSGWRT